VFWLLGLYEPIIENAYKTNFKMLFFFLKKSHVDQDILCPHISFWQKRTFYVASVKRQKCGPEKSYVHTQIFLFYTWHNKCSFFSKNLCANIVCQDVHAKKILQFFLTFWIMFSGNGFICSHEPKWISDHSAPYEEN
jgi:hypothetical protein